MNTEKLFTFIKASKVLPLAGIEYNTTSRNKMRQKNNRGTAIDFTADEKRKIELAIWSQLRSAGVEIRRDRAKKSKGGK